jgi:uracil-DNA glycosylase family 4
MHINTAETTRFTELISEAAQCTRCPAMCERSAVLSDLNGELTARVLFIGEAPGRKGADRTRIPFSGDQSGKNFDRFLSAADLTREQIFITSAALCNPRTESGANRRPTITELKNCSPFLIRVIKILDPRVIVTLGSVALEALKRIHYHELTLKQDAAKIHEWDGRMLVPIYHPSPQVLASHRREEEQLRDYAVVKQAVQQVSINSTGAVSIHGSSNQYRDAVASGTSFPIKPGHATTDPTLAPDGAD